MENAGKIAIMAQKEGAIVKIPYDRPLIDAFRKKFPASRFNSQDKTWFVPGNGAGDLLADWVNAIGRQAEKFLASQTKTDGETKPSDLASLDRIAGSLRGNFVVYRKTKAVLEVSTPYHAEIVRLCRTVPGAQWHKERNIWIVPLHSVQSLKAVLPKIRELSAMVLSAKTKPEFSTRNQKEEKPSKNMDRKRFLCLARDLPDKNKIIERNSKKFIVNYVGTLFRLGHDHPALNESGLASSVGEIVAWVYVTELN